MCGGDAENAGFFRQVKEWLEEGGYVLYFKKLYFL